MYSKSRFGIIAFVLAGFIIFASCSTPKRIGADYDKSVNFKKYRTYAWIPQADISFKDNRYNNQIIENNIKLYACSTLQKLGLALDTTKPDLLLSYELEIEKGERTTDVPIYGHPHNFNQFWGNPMNPMMNSFNPSLDPFNGMIMTQRFNPFGGGIGMMNNFWAPPPPMVVGYRTRQIPFKEGTVVVTAVDRKTNRLIWRGWGASCIMDPYNFKKELSDKIEAMFEKFPVGR